MGTRMKFCILFEKIGFVKNVEEILTYLKDSSEKLASLVINQGVYNILEEKTP